MNRKRLIKIAAWVLFGPLAVLFFYSWAIYYFIVPFTPPSDARAAAVGFALGLQDDTDLFTWKFPSKITDERIKALCPQDGSSCRLVYPARFDDCRPIHPLIPHRCVTVSVEPSLLMDKEAYEVFKKAVTNPCAYLPGPAVWESRPKDGVYRRTLVEWWNAARCDKGGKDLPVYIRTHINKKMFESPTPLERE